MDRLEVMKRVGVAGIWTLVLVTASTAFAQGEELAPINDVVSYIERFLTGDLARSVAVIGLAVVGYLFYAGRIAAAQAAAVVGGIALVFGAAEIVRVLSGEAGTGG